MTVLNEKQEKMLNVNKVQKEFYDTVIDSSTPPKNSNIITLVWWKLRDLQQQYRATLNINQYIYQQHKIWLGDLSQCDVLDLGCYTGNYLSLYLAQNSKSYIAIDLSETGIAILADELKKNNLPNTKVMSVDFLSEDFQNTHKGKFDVIYANGVAHHFEFFDILLDNLSNVLKKNGRVIMLDPMQTSTIMSIARAIYRPFQSDKGWEWPFSKNTFERIQQKFTILGLQGIMGRAKWGAALFFINKKLGISAGQKFHSHDLKNANNISAALWSCMQVIMCIEKKGN